MFEARTGVNEHKFRLVFKNYFVVRPHSLLNHVIHELIFNETRACQKNTFHNVEVHVPQNRLHYAFVEASQTLESSVKLVNIIWIKKYTRKDQLSVRMMRNRPSRQKTSSTIQQTFSCCDTFPFLFLGIFWSIFALTNVMLEVTRQMWAIPSCITTAAKSALWKYPRFSEFLHDSGEF